MVGVVEMDARHVLFGQPWQFDREFDDIFKMFLVKVFSLKICFTKLLIKYFSKKCYKMVFRTLQMILHIFKNVS